MEAATVRERCLCAFLLLRLRALAPSSNRLSRRTRSHRDRRPQRTPIASAATRAAAACNGIASSRSLSAAPERIFDN